MLNPDIRQQIHKLIDKADENQLNAVLEVFQPAESPYTQEEINSFYQRAKQVKDFGSNGYSVEESHALIRSKFKQHGAKIIISTAAHLDEFEGYQPV